MVWLEKADGLALSDTKDLWNNIRDGKKLTYEDRPIVGFRVIKEFLSPHLKNRFLPCMQGQVLYRQDNGVYVQVRDLFDADGNFLKDWVHKDALEIGIKRYGTWKIDICRVPRTSSKLMPNELDLLNDPDCSHLALGISTFLKKLTETDPICLTSYLRDRLGGALGSKIPWITATVMQGIKKAGLLKVLNNPQFTIQQLVASAVLDCSYEGAQKQAGIYFRFYSAPNTNQSGPRKDCSLYVGQSWDLHARCKRWISGELHKKLRGRADSIQMRALCPLDSVFYDDHKFIIEQLFTSLLQTYREDALEGIVDAEDHIGGSHQKNHADLVEIATAASKESSWTGLNYQCPLAEPNDHESLVWLRTDGYIPDPDQQSNSIPVSNFTRVVPLKMNIHSPDDKSRVFLIFNLPKILKISRSIKKGQVPDGVEWPVEDSFFNLTFEVRTDWKPHPYSWARLPLIGPFQDWDRANSWAISMDWIDPKSQHRQKYLHCVLPLQMVSETSAGSVYPYARGIEIIHWLYREKIPVNEQHSWILTPPMAHVNVVKRDHVLQKITFESAGAFTKTAPIPSNRKTADAIRAEMEGRGPHGDFGLAHVGLTLDEAKQAIKGTNKTIPNARKQCDSCNLIKGGISLPGGCGVKKKHGIVCLNCLHFYGRPVCSWTAETPSTGAGNPFTDFEARGDAANVLRRKALNGLPGWTGTDTMAADPIIMEIDQGDELEGMDDSTLDAADRAGKEESDWEGP